MVSLVNLLETIATTGAIFSLQFTKTVWRRWGSLSAPPLPQTHSRNRGPTSKGKGKEGTGGEGKGARGGDRTGREGRGREGKGKEGTGKEGEGKGGGRKRGEGRGKRPPMNVGWLRPGHLRHHSVGAYKFHKIPQKLWPYLVGYRFRDSNVSLLVENSDCPRCIRGPR